MDDVVRRTQHGYIDVDVRRHRCSGGHLLHARIKSHDAVELAVANPDVGSGCCRDDVRRAATVFIGVVNPDRWLDVLAPQVQRVGKQFEAVKGAAPIPGVFGCMR